MNTVQTQVKEPPALVLKANYREAAAWNLFAMINTGNPAQRWKDLSDRQREGFRNLVDLSASAALSVLER